ncbi:pilus assembly PilX N-terminal domain-containing protein [Patescibacteria group bacterium]|nr:pilus assembly PilX N-terminal domain-containing protein [Patescibacteria group bacterium]
MSKFSQRGVSLYLAIIIMVILLTIVLSVATILVGQLRMIKEMENSVIAFYAADTGIEEVLRVIIHDVGTPNPRYPLTGQTSVGDASYYVRVFLSGESDCNASLYCIKSVGTYKETRRAIEVEI